MAANRRIHRRTAAGGGNAICRTSSSVAGYEIIDASIGGVLLGVGNLLCAGTGVELALWWPELGLATAKGEVVRADSNQHQIAVAFDDLDQEGRALLSELLEHDVPSALLLCSRGIEEAVELHGYIGVHTATPLNAVHALETSKQLIEAVFVEADTDGLDFLRFLRDEHPAVRRIAITTEGDRAGLVPSLVDDIVDLGDCEIQPSRLAEGSAVMRRPRGSIPPSLSPSPNTPQPEPKTGRGVLAAGLEVLSSVGRRRE